MKKAFTLVELLGVIIILGVLALITYPIIYKTIKNSKEEALKQTIKNIEDAAYNYSVEYDIGYKTYYRSLQLSDLVSNGFLKGKIINPITDEQMKGCVLYKWDEVNNQYIFEYDEECIIPIPASISFAEDSWETINTIVEMGLANDYYNVGDTKEVTVNGYTNGTENTFTVRIANMSTPTECETEGFSQTACGFVVEFVDIITTHVMNSLATNSGGWPASELYSFVNNDLYNALPDELKKIIIDTYTVSGSGIKDSTNFVSNDKLYLLSPKELWNMQYNIDADKSRQFDYYKNNNVTLSNYSGEIKLYQGIETSWWLRTAEHSSDASFSIVNSGWDADIVDSEYGVAPAFRIGN